MTSCVVMSLVLGSVLSGQRLTGWYPPHPEWKLRELGQRGTHPTERGGWGAFTGSGGHLGVFDSSAVYVLPNRATPEATQQHLGMQERKCTPFASAWWGPQGEVCRDLPTRAGPVHPASP